MSAPCTVCGTQMEARRSTRRFCSTRCRMENYRNPALSVTAASVATPAPVSSATPTPKPAATGLRQPLASIAAGIATPVDAFGPARAYCEVRDGGHGVVFGLDSGRRNEPAGPTFERPRDAIRLAELLNERIGPGAPA